MFIIKKNDFYIKIIYLFVTILFTFFLFISLYDCSKKTIYSSNFFLYKFILSWIGIVIYIFSMFLICRIYKQMITPITIFLSFLFIFNYGQCFLWAFNIHIANELGAIPLFSNYGVPSDMDIVKTQLLTIVLFLYMCLGIIVSCGDRKKTIKIKSQSGIKRIMYKISLYCSLIVIPLTLVYVIYMTNYSIKNGYSALYYSEFSESTYISIMRLVEIYFFPCLIGLLISSNYNKKIRFIVYSIFFIYFSLYLIAGERGNWIYKLVVLMWLENRYYKKFNIKKLIKYFILGVVFLYFLTLIMNLRAYGVANISTIPLSELINLHNFPVFTFIGEMGGSIGILLIVFCSNFEWQYSNTFLVAILGMPTTKIPSLLGLDVKLASSILSSDFLKINWGTGFSLFAEAYMNFGIIGSGLCCLIIGIFISKILYVSKSSSLHTSPLKVFFVATTLEVMCGWPRSISLTPLRNWFRGPLFITIFIYIIYYICVELKEVNTDYVE